MEEGRARPSNECIEWDALNQLTAINQGTHRSEFAYDGEGRRVRFLEKENGSTVEDRRFLWNGLGIAEERDTAGTVVKRHMVGGFQQSGSSYFHSGDHLGSGRELTDVTGTVRARYDFDGYGRRTKVAGDLDQDLAFGGTMAHGATGLSLAVYRGYDPELGRWLSQDPIGLSGGLNLYAYAEGNPTNLVDPLGLDPWWQNALNSQVGMWIVNTSSADFFAGFGDSASFGVSNMIRDSMGLNGFVNKCSGAYVWGGRTELLMEIAGMGVSAGLKKLLARKGGSQVARAEARNVLRNVPRNGGQIHHKNPLAGHPIDLPGGGNMSTFPTGGLNRRVHSGRWNRTGSISDEAHDAAHLALMKQEAAVEALLLNPAATGARFVLNETRNGQCP